jgi:hypothetical protein
MQNLKAGIHGQPSRDPQQARFPKSRRTFEDEDTALSVTRSVQYASNQVDLSFPLQKTP